MAAPFPLSNASTSAWPSFCSFVRSRFPLVQALYGKTIVRILSRPGKMGLGTAYMDGLRIITGSHVILMDADMSHHPKCVLCGVVVQFQKPAFCRQCDCESCQGTNLIAGKFWMALFPHTIPGKLINPERTRMSSDNGMVRLMSTLTRVLLSRNETAL